MEAKAGSEQFPIIPEVEYIYCPIRASLGVLGKKWALLLLRDIAFLTDITFSDLLENNTGLTPRVLSMRLREMYDDGLIEKIRSKNDARKVYYKLSEKGRDVIPVLAALIQYSVKNNSGTVFEDGEPRALSDLYPGKQATMLGELLEYARRS